MDKVEAIDLVQQAVDVYTRVCKEVNSRPGGVPTKRTLKEERITTTKLLTGLLGRKPTKEEVAEALRD